MRPSLQSVSTLFRLPSDSFAQAHDIIKQFDLSWCPGQEYSCFLTLNSPHLKDSNIRTGFLNEKCEKTPFFNSFVSHFGNHQNTSNNAKSVSTSVSTRKHVLGLFVRIFRFLGTTIHNLNSSLKDSGGRYGEAFYRHIEMAK